MAKLRNSIFPLEQKNGLHVYRGKNFMLQPSDDNKHIAESIDKANI